MKVGSEVAPAALRAGLSSAELQHWLDRERDPLSPRPAPSTATPADDDPAVRIARQVVHLVEGFRAGHAITGLDPDHYKSYLRPVLRTFSDPYAVELMSNLDRRFGLA